MNWWKKYARVMPFSTDENSDFEEATDLDLYDTADKMDKIFRDRGIRYDRQKDLSHVALEDDNSVIGALASGWTDSGEQYEGKPVYDFSFDLAVHQQHEGKGVAKAMIEQAIAYYSDSKNAYSENGFTRMKVRAINPIVIHLLENHYQFELDSVNHKDANGEPDDAYLVRY